MGPLIGSVAVAFALTVGGVQTQTFRGDQSSCENLAAVAWEATGLRDNGIGWDTFGPWIQARLNEAKLNPASYVKDDEDVQFVFRSLKAIWDNPSMDADVTRTAVYESCMRKPTSV